MTEFKFKGDWEFNLDFESFKTFNFNSETPGNVWLEISSEGDIFEPTIEQIHSINYILSNQSKIAKILQEKIYNEATEILTDWEILEEDNYKNFSVETIGNFIELQVIEVFNLSKDGSAYYEIRGNCEWDEEHGFIVLMHKCDFLEFGQIGYSTFWTALDNSGKKHEYHEKQKLLESQPPIKYIPNSKTGKLTPFQKSENDSYEIKLITKGFNEIFFENVQKGIININDKKSNKSLLEWACLRGNFEIAKFLIDNDANLNGALFQCYGFGYDPSSKSKNGKYQIIELLLEKGLSINEKDEFGRTLLYLACEQLNSYYHLIEQNSPNARQNENFITTKETIKELFKLGAIINDNPKENFNPLYTALRNLNEDSKDEIKNLLKNDSSKKNWWEFWKK